MKYTPQHLILRAMMDAFVCQRWQVAHYLAQQAREFGAIPHPYTAAVQYIERYHAPGAGARKEAA